MDACVRYAANENSHREGRRPWPCELVGIMKFAELKAWPEGCRLAVDWIDGKRLGLETVLADLQIGDLGI